jgi:hypothetical protein
MENYENCGVENFVMMSRRMWRVIAGFDEGNDDAEMYSVFLAKFMRHVYVAVRMFTQPIALHSNDAVMRDPLPSNQNIAKILEDKACYGESEDSKLNEMFWGAYRVILTDDIIWNDGIDKPNITI